MWDIVTKSCTHPLKTHNSNLSMNLIAIQSLNPYSIETNKTPLGNKWCFRSRFCTCKAILGRGQPGPMRWILLEPLPPHAPDAGSIARPVNQQSSALPLHCGCPLPHKKKPQGRILMYSTPITNSKILLIETQFQFPSHYQIHYIKTWYIDNLDVLIVLYFSSKQY